MLPPPIHPVAGQARHPASTGVVIIGAGVVGLFTALFLAERGERVCVIEKGRIAGEQSSRNLGWVRKMGRAAPDVPLSLAADRLWADMDARLGADVGYRQAGIMYLAQRDTEMAGHEAWLTSAGGLTPGARLLSSTDIETMVPCGAGSWAGGLPMPSDGRAEPQLVASHVAAAAMRAGVVIVENCAVRGLMRAGGAISGVWTEQGEITCDRVLLAGGMWSRRFLGNHGIGLPTLPLIASVLMTAPMEGPTEIAVGGPDFSFRKRLDGGFTITQRGKLDAPLTPDHLLIGLRYLPVLRGQRNVLEIGLGKPFLDDLRRARRWNPRKTSPFEDVRVLNPAVNTRLNRDALANLARAWPQFSQASIVGEWSGAMDVTPDSLPVISTVARIPGLVIASGFSGHGFGTSPGAGQLAADLLTGRPEIVDPTPYRLSRFGMRGGAL